jgi:hypothetical protein
LGHGAGAYRDFYRFDPDHNTWNRLADFPAQARVAGTQFSFGGRAYIASGLGANDQPLPAGEFWEYEPTSDSWTQLSAPRSGRWAPGTFVVGSTVICWRREQRAVQQDVEAEMNTAEVNGTTANGGVSLILYPNPVSGRELRLLYQVPGLDTRAIYLMKPDGRRVAELASTSSTIQIPRQLAAGCYFLSVVTSDGAKHTRPIVVLR